MSTPTPINKETLTLMKTGVVDVVSGRVRSLIEKSQLHLPPDYSAENALKSAWLTLQSTVDKNKRPVLEVCTPDSIANSLLYMVVQALNPGKNQCYFIAYGTQLACQRSYFGDIALVGRIKPDSNVYYEVIWEGDEVHYEIHRGQKSIVKHVQKLENIGNLSKVKGAYCVIEVPGQPDRTTIMTIDQIQNSWKKSKQFGEKEKTPHTEQPDQMALRTVIRRACKPIINSSDDSYLLLAVQRSEVEAADAEIDAEALLAAGGEVIDLDQEQLTALQGETARGTAEEVDANREEPEPVATGRRRPGF